MARKEPKTTPETVEEVTAPVTRENLTTPAPEHAPAEIVALVTRNGSRVTVDGKLANILLGEGYTLAE